jgi:MFS family permease
MGSGPRRLPWRPRRAAADAPGAFDRTLIAPMILGSILNPINSSIIAVSLVPIGIAFGAPPSETAWLVSALYLATAIGQPVVGRLVDTYGPRRLFLSGATLVGIAGILGTVAPSLPGLVVARILLGFGTCAGYPAAMYLIRSEAARTGRDSPGGVLTALAVAAQTISVVGPTLGGLLIGLGGWRATFAINIPLSVACLVLGARRLPRARTVRPAGRLDVGGIVLFAAMLTSLLLFLMRPRVDHLYLLGLTAVAAAALTRRELRVAEPFIDLRVLGGNLPLIATYVRNLLGQTVSYCFLYGYTQWMEGGHGLHPTEAGLVLLPLSLVAIVVAAVTGRRPQIRGKLLVGGLTQVLACALLLVVHPTSAIVLLVAVVVVMGVPQGLNSLANQNAVYHQADAGRIGSSAGLLRTSTYLGAIAASAASGAFLEHSADTSGLQDLALFMMGAAVLFLAVTAVDRSLHRVGARDDAPDTTAGAPVTR